VERLLATVQPFDLSDVVGKPSVLIQVGRLPIHCRRRRWCAPWTTSHALGSPPPPDLDVTAQELDAAANGFVSPDTPARRYAWTRSLTFMREAMQAGTSARIAMGGKLKGYQGLWPGVLEEGIIALRAGQPLYLLGLFGGAARLLIDVLRGVQREEFTSAWLSALEGSDALRNKYRRRGHTIQSPEELAAELKQRGKAGLSAALNNGLSEDENIE
jgi:hypothetical protein